MKTTLLVMTLNEIDGMRVIMPQVNPAWCGQIIIVDGGSTDGTVEWALEHGYTVYIQKQVGFRHAYSEVLPLIEGDVIITFSPDGNSMPSVIPELIAKMEEGYDMVIASRYLPGARSDDDDFVTAFGNWFFTRTLNLLFGANYTDVMVIFRAYRKKVVHDLQLISDEGYAFVENLFRTKISWEPLLSVRAAKRKLRVTEIPGNEPRRIGGQRKLQVFRWGGAYYLQFWREKFYWK